MIGTDARERLLLQRQILDSISPLVVEGDRQLISPVARSFCLNGEFNKEC